MALKRGLVGDEGNQKQERNLRFKFTKCMWKDEWLQKYSAQLENIIRKVVREEAEQAVLRSLPSIPRSLPNQAELSESKKFQLHFEGKLPGRLYTGNNVEAEGPSPVKLVLRDAISGHIVTDGPLSLLKVELVVLHGHFKVEHLDDWTHKEFNDNIIPARDGKRPLLVGERLIPLHNGSGFVNGVSFTDNSSWVRSKMFRLGAKVFLSNEDQVREAVSGAFEVKDRRGETYQKYNTPSLEDEVWRLRGISKDGKICRRLAEHHIFKVKDFLEQYQINQLLLRQVLNVSPKKWETIVQQATLCFSSNMYINPSVFMASDIPTAAISPSTIPNLALQRLCVPAASQDQPVNLSVPVNEEPSQAPAARIDNNSLICDDGHICSHNGALYGQDMFDARTSNWVSIAQTMGEEGNGSFVSSSRTNCYLGNFPSIPEMDPSTSDVAMPEAGLE